MNLEEKVLHRKLKMREYAIKFYNKNIENQQKKGLNKYYNKKNIVSENDKIKYGIDLALVMKTINCLDKLSNTRPEFLEELFLKYKIE